MTSTGEKKQATSSELAQLQQVVAELLNVLHAQAKEIEQLTMHVERHTDRLLHPSQMALLVSELSELQSRVKNWQVAKP